MPDDSIEKAETPRLCPYCGGLLRESQEGPKVVKCQKHGQMVLSVHRLRVTGVTQ